MVVDTPSNGKSRKSFVINEDEVFGWGRTWRDSSDTATAAAHSAWCNAWNPDPKRTPSWSRTCEG